MPHRFLLQRVASLALPVAASSFAVWWFGGTAIGAELNFLSFFCTRPFGVRRCGRIYGCTLIFFDLVIALGGLSFGTSDMGLGECESAIVFAGGILVLASLTFSALGRSAHRAGLAAASARRHRPQPAVRL